MIHEYNRKQNLKAALSFIGGFFSCICSYFFFFLIIKFISWQYGFEFPKFLPYLCGVLGLLATWLSGYKIWKNKGGLIGYHESALYHDFGDEIAGAMVTDHYLHRITGPAHMLSQIFLAGPIWILGGFTLLKSKIPFSEALDANLARVLKELRGIRKWQGLADHPTSREEILYLAQMNLIDFSVTREVVRFKAS